MHALLLAATLAAAPLAGDAELAAPADLAAAPARSGSAVAPPAPGSARLAASVPGAAAGTTSSMVLPGLALLALAAVAFTLSRRKAVAAGRMLQVVESTPLGPRRSIAVVRVGAEALVLGVSEGGVSLLATRPAAELEASRAATPRADRPAAFDALLTESVEHQELRRKLQQVRLGDAR